MRHPRISLLALVLALLAPAMARAQTPRLEGTYTYVASASDDIGKAIEQGTAKMNFITRPIARGRLRKTNPVYRTVMIAHTPTEVRVTTDGRAPIVSPADGAPIRWKREDGEELDVSTEWEDGALEQTFEAPDGKRVNVYRLSPDGRTLTMTVTVTSPRLPAPITYDLAYARQ